MCLIQLHLRLRMLSSFELTPMPLHPTLCHSLCQPTWPSMTRPLAKLHLVPPRIYLVLVVNSLLLRIVQTEKGSSLPERTALREFSTSRYTLLVLDPKIRTVKSVKLSSFLNPNGAPKTVISHTGSMLDLVNSLLGPAACSTRNEPPPTSSHAKNGFSPNSPRTTPYYSLTQTKDVDPAVSLMNNT